MSTPYSESESCRVDDTGTKLLAQRLARRVLVGGILQPALAEEILPVINPATLETISEVPRCGAEDVDRAVAAALAAFGAWSRIPPRERGRLLSNAVDSVAAELETLARLQTLETGHPIASLSRGDAAACVDMLRMFAGLGGEIKGRTVSDIAGLLHCTVCEPLGVVGAVIPWNGPVFTAAAKLGPALMAGNTIVIKTAEEAPLAILFLCELLQTALPSGVLNVISGVGAEAGRQLAQHPDVRKLSFTGSVPVGQQIMHYAADKMVPITLELGGMNPNIVAADADIDRAVAGIVHGMRFARQSQSCIAGTRVLVHADVYDDVVSKVVKRVSAIVVGDPFDPGSQVGALSSKRQYDRLSRLMASIRSTDGVRTLCGGGRPALPDSLAGYFLQPTLVDGLPLSSPLCQDEVFGPLAMFVPWTDFDEVINTANATRYGLVATLWSRDIGRSLEFASRVQAGLVQVNHYTGTRPNVSYGGTKMSGLGKEYTLESMIQHFTFSKTLILAG